jgi:hypothetical protein
MEFIERTDDGPEHISIARCRELLGDEAESMTDQEIALIRRHAETMAYMAIDMYWKTTIPVSRNHASQARLARGREWVCAADHGRAVIYVRVSTKEQTENLSLPTQLRACEEYCRRQGYEIVERFHEEGESAKTTDRSQLAEPAHVLPAEQRTKSNCPPPSAASRDIIGPIL